MHVQCLSKFRSYTSEKVFTLYIEVQSYGASAVLLIQVHHKIKNYLLWEAVNISAKCEKICRCVLLFKKL